MTATPSAAEQAEQWAKDYENQRLNSARIALQWIHQYEREESIRERTKDTPESVVVSAMLEEGRWGYLAGHAAGEVAGAERERARICAWTEQESGNYAYTTVLWISDQHHEPL